MMRTCTKCRAVYTIYRRTVGLKDAYKNLRLISTVIPPVCRPVQPVRRCAVVQRSLSTVSDSLPSRNNQEDDRVPDTDLDGKNISANPIRRSVGTTRGEQRRLSQHKPDQPGDARLLKVAIIGSPNAGKSTLVNQLLEWKIAPVSQKVHTTRQRTVGVWSEGNTQVVLLDTPGIIQPAKRKKHNLEHSLLTDPHATLYEADLIVVIVDVSCVWNRAKLDQEVLKVLHLHSHRPSVLVLNKVDIVKKKYQLLQVTRLLTEGIVGGKRDSYKMKEIEQAEASKKTLEEMFATTQKSKGHPMRNPHSSEHTSDDVNSDNIIQRANDNQENIMQPDTILYNKSSQEGLDSDETLEESSVNGAHSDDSVEELTSSSAVWDGQSAPDLSNSQVWHVYHSRLRELDRTVKDKKGWPHFSKVFMISALDGDGVADMKEYLLSCAVPSSWKYHSSVVTDQDPQEVARLTVWAKLLEHLPAEIPYNIKVKKTLWEVDENDSLHAGFDLVCCRKREMHSCIGKGGSTLRRISTEAKQELMNIFRREMTLGLAVKLKK